jgi:hypothetical protein
MAGGVEVWELKVWLSGTRSLPNYKRYYLSRESDKI